MRQFKVTQRITGRESNAFKAYLKEISQIDIFETPEKEAECAYRAFEGDEDAINELVNRNLRFVVSVAKNYYTNSNVTLEDLVNEGNIGLLSAAKKFNPSSGNKFISYAVWHIRKHIMEYLTNSSRTIRIPANKVNALNSLNKKMDVLTQSLSRSVELADLLNNIDGMDNNEIESLVNINNISMQSFDKKLTIDNDSGTLLDVIESHEFEPTDLAMEQNQNTLVLNSLINKARPVERQVLRLYFGIGLEYGLNLHEIGSELGISRERVRQIKENGLKRLRIYSREMGINELSF
jgi:RNA polymerase primary sigma factor